MLVGLVCLFAVFSSTNSVAQSLKSGGIVFAFPDRGAWEFILLGGGPNGVNKCPPIDNGFCYVNGGFHLLLTGPPGLCQYLAKGHASCKFDGDYALTGGKLTRLDANCNQLSFPIINGNFQFESRLGLQIYSPVNALYTQTICNLGDAGTSVFDAGGSLVIYLPGYVP
jgi:hypothetical protein